MSDPWKPFRAYGYIGGFCCLFAGKVLFSASVKERLSYWGLGFEIFPQPIGIGFFIGPFLLAFGLFQNNQNPSEKGHQSND